MRFGVLGPVEVWHGGESLAIGGPQQRALLAMLLLNANRVVSTDRLVADLWGDQPPATARGLLQGCVAGLRRALLNGVADAEQPLYTRSPGYLLRVGPRELDLDRFEELARAASQAAGRGSVADLEQAAAQLSEALSLWRGPALDGIDVPGCRAEVARLEERRLAVLEERVDIDLRLGRHAQLVGELQAQVQAHPLRERAWAQLMLALHLADRRADALAAHRQLRQSLVEQLGVEPGATVQRLQRAMLAGDDPLAAYPLARGVPASPAGGEPAAPGKRPVPAQLPAAPAAFTGRAAHLERLNQLLAGSDPGLRIAVISGMGGVGKTALAVHWAHQVRDRFPDGQLYVDLRGYLPPPARPIEALGGFLQAMGVPAEQIPAELAPAAARYRSLLADRRVLVVLDNAQQVEQVRPLLPGGGNCLVLVTSRERLADLVAIEGATHIDLDVLAPDEARSLLARVLGEERIEAEPQACVELLRMCAFLPLALRISAANLALAPRLGIAEQVARLASGDRLATLAVDPDSQTAVRAVFDQSYATLPADARRLFPLLGLVPGPHVTAGAAAALAGTGLEPAARLLDRLARAHLLDQPTPGTYTLHDLVRLYAAGRAGEDSIDSRQAATGRLFDWYLSTTDAAARLLYPHAQRLPVTPAAPAITSRFDDYADALAWLEAERPNLVAAIEHAAARGPRPVAYQLADALQYFYIGRPYVAEWLAVTRAELSAAWVDGNQEAEAAAERGLGNAYTRQNRYPEALAHHRQALALSEQAGAVEAQAAALNGLGLVYRRQWQLTKAIDCFRQALSLNRRGGHVDGQVTNLGNLGLVSIHLGRLQQAANYTTQALTLARQPGFRSREAVCLGNLGEIYHLLGRPDQAEANLDRALVLFDEIGELTLRSEHQRSLAAVYRDTGRYPRALELAAAALAFASEGGRREVEADAHAVLGTIHHRLGHHQRALDHHKQALRLGRETGNQLTVAAALAETAATQLSLGRIGDADETIQLAVQQSGEAGFRLEEGCALTTLASIDLAAGRLDDAIAHAQRAIAIQRETGHRLGEARACQQLGQALDRSGDVAAALTSHRRAYALFAEVGSPEADQLAEFRNTQLHT